MADIGEGAMIGLIAEHRSKCELCSDPPPKSAPKTNIVAKWDEDPDAAIGNDSGELESNMAAQGSRRPTTWKLSGKIKKRDMKGHVVTPNPHHLIPGNESLKVSKMPDWLFEGKKITGDIGYDVNNDKNGIWLPSNNSMRGDDIWENPDFKKEYVIKAMTIAGGHFHDRHVDYSKFVTKILNKIADRLDGIKVIDMDCPYETKKAPDGRKKPPFFVVVRLNGVSRRLSGHLAANAPRQRFLYTSKLVKHYWDAKKTKALQG